MFTGTLGADYISYIVVQQVGSYVKIKTGSKSGSKLRSGIVSKVGSKTGSKNSVLAYLKCMDGSVLAFLKCMDGSVLVTLKCMDGSVLAHIRTDIQSAPTRFQQLGNSCVPELLCNKSTKIFEIKLLILVFLLHVCLYVSLCLLRN